MERIRTRPIDTIEPEEWFTEDIMWQVTLIQLNLKNGLPKISCGK